MLRGFKHVVAFFAHTDDEMICAGTLHRLARSGAKVFVHTMAPAATENDREGWRESAETVRPEFLRSMVLIKATDYKFHELVPSSDFASKRQEIANRVFFYCDTYKPDAAFILSPEDENPAHRVMGEECERVMRGRVPTTIRCLFPWNHGIGRPNLYVRMNDEDLAVKDAVADAYQSQKFRYSYKEIFRESAILDGRTLKCGPVERFEILRHLV